MTKNYHGSNEITTSGHTAYIRLFFGRPHTRVFLYAYIRVFFGRVYTCYFIRVYTCLNFVYSIGCEFVFARKVIQRQMSQEVEDGDRGG